MIVVETALMEHRNPVWPVGRDWQVGLDPGRRPK
jgi:hypothetical protein